MDFNDFFLRQKVNGKVLASLVELAWNFYMLCKLPDVMRVKFYGYMISTAVGIFYEFSHAACKVLLSLFQILRALKILSL